MIEQEIILLGLLKEAPRHGYEIKTKIKEILAIFAGVDLKSIYYPLTVLEKRGLVSRHKAKPGRRPERYVYELTTKGKRRFDELLTKSFLDFKRPQFSLDLSLYFLPYIKADIARRRLRGRVFILDKLCRELKQVLESKRKKGTRRPLLTVIEHNIGMMEAESRFLRHLIATL